MAPFYDHCNGHRMKKEEAFVEEVTADTTTFATPDIKKSNSIVEKDTIINTEKYRPSIFQNIYVFIDDSNSENAFEMAMMCEVYFDFTFEEFKRELIKDFYNEHSKGIAFHIKNICFLFIILFSTSILFLSFFKKIELVYNLSKINLILLFIALIIILLFDPFFETYKQIKWGYYAFILVEIGIFYTAKSNLKSKV
jgi:hypothetical protein